MAVQTNTRPRPAVFRALGKDDPPETVQIRNQTYRLVEVLKHDSWAATALYEGGSGKVICKFNRRQSIFLFPMKWLGWILARREERILRRLGDLPNIPQWSGHVYSRGKRLYHAVAHAYVEGRPLSRDEHLDDDFFPALKALLAEMHHRNLAYVDLHKLENVLVGEDGRPYLIDFQISAALPRWWPANAWPMRMILRILQKSDDYHLQKMHARCRPDQAEVSTLQMRETRPWYIRFHRLFARPWRAFRRKLLVILRVRSGQGRAASEQVPEDAFRKRAA